jgi:membrane protease YdiL (CAAX protease family)
MRIAPEPLIGVIAVVVYAAVMAGTWWVLGMDYDTVGDSTGNIIKGIVAAVGLAVLVLIGLTSWLGWWRPAMREERRVAPRWTLVVPVVMLVIALLNVVSIDYSAMSATWVVSLALGVALVGFGEELVTRGVALVGFRGRFSEVGAWAASSTIFALLHAMNMLFGQSVAATAQQMVMAFLLGSALYVVRMSTGTLVAGMGIHAVWDFGSVGMGGSGADQNALTLVGGLTNNLLMLTGLVAAIVIARRVKQASADALATPATA